MTWNISNVGAIATVESESYGVSLAAVGLLTTALFVTHLAVQIPGGRLIDRVGARTVGLAALAIVAAGNAIALTSPTLGIGLGARALMGLGTGVGFVAGIDLVRAGQGGAFWQGAYGGSTMAAAGLALMVVPQLVGELGWRAPFWTGLALALVALLPVSAADRSTPANTAGVGRLPVTQRAPRPASLAARCGADGLVRALGRRGELDRDPARARRAREEHRRGRRRAHPLRGDRHAAGRRASDAPRTRSGLDVRRHQPSSRARRESSSSRPGRRCGSAPSRRSSRVSPPVSPSRPSSTRRFVFERTPRPPRSGSSTAPPCS